MIDPSEISDILKQQLDGIKEKTAFEEVGTVLNVGDGVAHVYGLENVEANELVEFDNGATGVAMNLEESNVGVILLEELKPYDLLAKRIKPFLRSHTHVLFVEEGIENGGAAALTLLSLHRCMGADFPADYHILAISDHFAAPSAPTDLYRFCKIGREDILANLI